MECECNMAFLEMFVHIMLVPTTLNNPQLDNLHLSILPFN